MQDNLFNSTIALAGMLQSVTLVREFAKTGKLPEDAFQACIYSIFQTHPEDLPEVYGKLSELQWGLEKLAKGIELTGHKSHSEGRLLLSLIHVQKKIVSAPALQKLLTNRLEQAKKQVNYFSLLHPIVIANLADIYLKTIGHFRLRLLILGSQRVLAAPENMEKIRALLLAGIRSAFLWRQFGGSRWQLLFSQKKIKTMAQTILHSFQHKEPL